MSASTTELISGLIRDVPDFPEPGVTFKDITPLLADPEGFAVATRALGEAFPGPVDAVFGMEARGFILGSVVARELGCGFVPVRKPGKLPREVHSEDYQLEYGSATLQVHADAVRPGARVLVVDDILATGGTVGAVASLVADLSAELVGVSVLLELVGLGGRTRLADAGVTDISAILTVA
ncbi:adenine phosphoribosyltransferase [Granulicoccus phenolivorans]|uniref:adenine phosphoribosyltransferase n=1 Tax=Granulicoccus phenolivorans TaxID=266854 RepID=UPI0004254DA3|nr:adenine phosphoribosyltransferase [Granulicoccus phenolivorans]